MASTVKYDGLEVGSRAPALAVTPTLVQLFLFSAVTWNAHLIHYDDAYAESEGYPAPVIHGPFQGALLGRLLTDWVGDAGTLSRLAYSHRGIAHLGDTITFRGEVVRKYEESGSRRIDVQLSVETQKGEVTTVGKATIDFPA